MQKTDGRAEENAEIDTPRSLGLGSAAMGHQRIGADAQNFVKREKRQHIASEGDTDRAR